MNDTLHTLLEHHRWANLALIDACADLTAEQLRCESPGGYGSIQATLDHLVSSEWYYLWVLHGRGDAWAPSTVEGAGVADLRAFADESGRRLLALADEGDPARTYEARTSGGNFDVPLRFWLAQAINHATEHRTNVTSSLAEQGLAAPELSGWTYFLATHST